MSIITLGVEFATMSCPGCAATFAVSRHEQTRWRNRERDHFACPYCETHMVPVGESEADRLKRELAWQKYRAERYEAQADTAERRASAYKGHLTRTRNRIAAGTCPCCNRHFQNLGRHMKNQHPQYAETE